MDRRSFLTGWAQREVELAPQNHSFSNGSHDRTLSAGLEPWVPDPKDAPWDAVRAGHLLRRTMMMPKWDEITKILALTPSAAVDLLLNTPSDPAPLVFPTLPFETVPGWTESLAKLDSPKANEMKGTWASHDSLLRDWYANVLLNSPLSIVEKMTFFWSGLLTSQFVSDESYVQAPLLYRQNILYRNGGLLNYKDLIFNTTLDAAMLVYLGGNVNTKSRANENYGRELMELFTMGYGSGYTEGDVKEAARILTGWRVGQYSDEAALNGPFKTYFSPKDHDTGAKQFLGVSFSAIVDVENTEYQVQNFEIRKLTNTIFLQFPQQVATYICRKIYKFFIYSNPGGTDEAVISSMAQLFIDSNFEIKPVISTLLKSAHFFDNANVGSQVKTPAEYIIGIARQLGYSTGMNANMMKILQEIFNPPNVSGWPGWHDWITTNTYPVRSTVVAAAISGMTDTITLDFIAQFQNSNDANKLITDLGALMLPRKLAKSRHDELVQILVGSGGKDYEWPTILSGNPSTAARNMRDVLTMICNLPDYQLA